MSRLKLNLIVFSVSACFFTLSCSHTPDKKPLTAQEQVIADQGLGEKLSVMLDREFKFKNSPEVTIYLRSLAQKLLYQTKEFQDSPIGVYLVREEKEIQNCAIPGVKVYLSTGLLKKIKFENVLAASIAFELGHVVKRHAAQNIEKRQTGSTDSVAKIEWGEFPLFGDGGILTYSRKENQEAAEFAVQMLYLSGYDPRGVIGFFRLLEETEKQNFFEKEEIKYLIEKANRTMSSLTPLLNPVVRTKEFVKFQQELKRT